MNRYKTLEVIGEGSYGIVLKCIRIETNDVVAIKKFKTDDADEETKKTSRREISLLKRLKSENIVELKEVFKQRGILHLVFEYLEKNLLDILNSFTSGLPSADVTHYAFQLLLAIQWCHSHDIIHRDVKPENILVNDKKVLKLGDFGFARTIRNQESVMLTDYVATRWYRAPELIISNRYGKPVDIWSVGCIFCELIDGKALFPGDNEIDQLFRIQALLGSLPASLMELLLKNASFKNLKFPPVASPETLSRHFHGRDRHLIDFVEKTLSLDPASRMTVDTCLQHTVFHVQRLLRLQKHYAQEKRTTPNNELTLNLAAGPDADGSGNSGCDQTEDSPAPAMTGPELHLLDERLRQLDVWLDRRAASSSSSRKQQQQQQHHGPPRVQSEEIKPVRLPTYRQVAHRPPLAKNTYITLKPIDRKRTDKSNSRVAHAPPQGSQFLPVVHPGGRTRFKDDRGPLKQ